MAAGNTYVALATQTLGSAAASVTFSSISGVYTDLVLVVASVDLSGASNCRYYYNSDNSSGLYSRTTLANSGASAISSRATASNYNFAAYATPTQGINIINIFNYANTNVFKTSIIRGGNADDSTLTRVNLWRNTNAITSVTVDTDGNQWVAGTIFSLYGIAAA
jgi:hypothetical protein